MAQWLSGLHTADRDHSDGFLCLCASMREHGCGGSTRNQLLEVACFSMALYGNARLGFGLYHLSRRAAAGLALGPQRAQEKFGTTLRTTLPRQVFRYGFNPIPPEGNPRLDHFNEVLQELDTDMFGFMAPPVR